MPDRTRLIAATNTGSIHIWELAEIRKQNYALTGVDWSTPALPGFQRENKPIRVEIDLGKYSVIEQDPE